MWRCLILLSSCLQLALQPGVGLLGTAQASFHDLQAEGTPALKETQEWCKPKQQVCHQLKHAHALRI